jgi:Transposase IS116/IS110/IS902 family
VLTARHSRLSATSAPPGAQDLALHLVHPCLPTLGANGGKDITREGGFRLAAGDGHHGMFIGPGQRPAGHPDAAIYLSQPGTGEILGARQLGEFGDDPHRYATAKARKNYAATSPVTRQSGKKKIVMARLIRNDQLADALHRQAQSALITSSGARAFYDEQRDRGPDHDAALRALSNRLVGILHGCLKTRTLYDEATAWSHRTTISGAA